MWAVPGYSARKWELETRAALLGFLVEKVVLVQIPIRVDCVWNVMAHAQKSDLVFRAKRTSPFKSARGASVQSTTSSRGVRISGSNAGYTMFRVSVKGTTGYPLHSPVSPSLPLPWVTVCHHISTGVYEMCKWNKRDFIPSGGTRYNFITNAFRPPLGPIRPIQLIFGVISPGSKRSSREADKFPLSTVNN